MGTPDQCPFFCFACRIQSGFLETMEHELVDGVADPFPVLERSGVGWGGPMRWLERPVHSPGTIGDIVGRSRWSQAGDDQHGAGNETIRDGLTHGASMPDCPIADRESRVPVCPNRASSVGGFTNPEALVTCCIWRARFDLITSGLRVCREEMEVGLPKYPLARLDDRPVGACRV